MADGPSKICIQEPQPLEEHSKQGSVYALKLFLASSQFISISADLQCRSCVCAGAPGMKTVYFPPPVMDASSHALSKHILMTYCSHSTHHLCLLLLFFFYFLLLLHPAPPRRLLSRVLLVTSSAGSAIYKWGQSCLAQSTRAQALGVTYNYGQRMMPA